MEMVNVEELFASKVFTLGKMKERLPKGTFKEVNKIINEGGELSKEAADVVAKAMKDLRQFMFERVYRNPVAKGEESKTPLPVQEG